MKNVVFFILQLVLFFFVFGAGSLFPPFHVEHVLGTSSAGTRIFVADGLILMIAVFLVILLMEGLRKRVMGSGVWTAAAFVVAAALGFAMKFGFLTRSAF